MARKYYRMSTVHAAEAAAGRLADESQTTVSRLLGYAHRHVLRVDHPDGGDPDPIISEIDPAARRLPSAPAASVV